MEERIIYNAVKCNHCKTTIVSKHVHDYVGCNCEDKEKQVFVDGGNRYLKRAYGNQASYNDISAYDDGKHETRRECLRWGVNYDKDMNRLPETEWRFIKNLDTDHIEAIIEGGYTRNNPFYEELFKEELKFRENDKK